MGFMDFFIQNGATIVIGLVLLAVVAAIILVMRKNRKKGKTSCGCGCENCPSAGMCHSTKTQK